jgi:uncharacterized membrane protein
MRALPGAGMVLPLLHTVREEAMKRWHWKLLQLRKRLWVRVTLWAVTGAVAALLAAATQYLLPWEPEITIGAEAVESILSIIASSMLAVTTFSLSTMLAAL